MTIKVNQRHNVRVECTATARAEGPKGPVKGICRNLSVGGFFFLGNPLPVGSNYEFTLELPVGRVNCLGEIRYQHSYPAEGPGVGVRFSRLAQEDLARVEQFLREYGH